MSSLLIRNASIVNEGEIRVGDVYVLNGRIDQIGSAVDKDAEVEIDANGLYLMPGIIDDQVHFREPGLTHKAEIFTESRAAVVGGVTSYMDMPNVKPPSLTQDLLEDRYRIASERSRANYSFYMGASNDNLEEVLKTPLENVCGVKIFMGSSTGNMLVDDTHVLEGIFKNCPALIAVHCEDEDTIRENLLKYRAQYGDDIPVEMHPVIRSVEACYKSSSFASNLAKKYGTRLHILHISTRDEIDLFRNDIPLTEKKITSEACVHHLFFDSSQYTTLGSKIKCNPAIKEGFHRDAIFQAVLDNKIDVIATDHAPHTMEEKKMDYIHSPAGLPLVQHSLAIMLDYYHKGKISLERIAEKMSHAVADCFKIRERGYLREGYWADMILVDVDGEWEVNNKDLLFKCGWSPLEGQKFKGRVLKTIVSGELAYDDGKIVEGVGMRMQFDRE
jgi:dihydroorotase